MGRDREIRLLKEYLHATAEEGKARLLSIVGVGGVGKSRLAWEFFKYVDGLTEEVYWNRGRCLAYGEGVAYWALSEMIRMRAGIVDNEAPAAAREKLRATVNALVPGDEERAWVEPRLAHLIGLEEGAASEPRDLYAAWRFFFEQMAADGLTVLVFEDMQWADNGLLDFVEYLLEWSRNSRILIVTLARPEITDRRPGWGAGKRGLTSLYLEPLTAEAMTQLLDGIVPGLPDDLSERIRDRAAGIPLYAVETVRMLLDRGLLVESGGVYRTTAELDSLEVPESLHALIAARLDSLPESERHALQDAAVLGKSFTAHALSAIAGDGGASPERGAACAGREGPPQHPVGSPLPRAWSVRVRAGPGAQRCVRHAGATRSQGAPPRRRHLPGERVERAGGGGRRRRRAPRRGVRRGAGLPRRGGDPRSRRQRPGARRRPRGIARRRGLGAALLRARTRPRGR